MLFLVRRLCDDRLVNLLYWLGVVGCVGDDGDCFYWFVCYW